MQTLTIETIKKKMPQWALFAAIDFDGQVTYFSGYPVLHKGTYVPQNWKSDKCKVVGYAIDKSSYLSII